MAIFFTTLLAGLILGSCVYLLSKKVDFLKVCLKDKVTGISRAGGLGIAAVFFMALFLSRQVVMPDGLLPGLLLVFLLGLFDDIFDFGVKLKFSLQFLIALFIVSAGVRFDFAYLSVVTDFLFSVIWIVGLMNAFNFLDILDGLAAGIGAISALAFISIGILIQNQNVAVLGSAMAASNISFLFFNFPKARLYMGDIGSLFNGALFACAAILATRDFSASGTAAWSLVFVLALPILDLIFVIVMRVISRRPFFQKSRDHFVLRLVAGGLSRVRAVSLMYLFGVLFCAGAVLFLMPVNFFPVAVTLAVFAVAAWLYAAFKMSKVAIGN